MKKKALITGVTGQDGSYLAEYLLKKNYIVHGINRRTSSFNTARIDHLIEKEKNFFLHYGDMTDCLSLERVILKVKPDEIYNLAAQSHVMVSFDEPEYTANTIALGTLRLLEILRSVKMLHKVKFYNASTSEIFGNSKKRNQNENTSFEPRSPYGTAKLYSHWITKNYRDAYGAFACNGILFNHESPRRGPTFVTKKIISALVKIKHNKQKKLLLGNLYASRDWGHAKDYAAMQWRILQQEKPEDYVIATGKSYTIKEFIKKTLKQLNMNVIWKGKGKNEKGYFNDRCIIEVNSKYLRPNEVNNLKGDPSKAKRKLNWKPTYSIDEIIKEIIGEELIKII
jgi:GDPmannose 4,6-dehydratase